MAEETRPECVCGSDWDRELECECRPDDAPCRECGNDRIDCHCAEEPREPRRPDPDDWRGQALDREWDRLHGFDNDPPF